MNQPSPGQRVKNRDAALRLQMVPGVGPRLYGQLIEAFGSASKVLAASPAELRSIPGVGTKLLTGLVEANQKIDIAPILETCSANQIHIVDRFDDSYPKLLGEIYDPPSVLFVQGTIQPADQMSIAIVGTRHSSNYGDQVAGKLAQGLALAGFTIVSGLARGIDAAAHKGALQAGGRTIAVLGGGLLKLYPPEHQSLAQQITDQGAVISEALPNQSPKSGSFPRRNRIVTGLSLGVIVVEAGDRSGALISARLSMEQNREVFAVPGRIDNRMAHGCHKLIRDGATLVETVGDVLEQLGPLMTPIQHSRDHSNPNSDGDSNNSGAGDHGNAQGTLRHPAELMLSEQEMSVLQSIQSDPTEFDHIMVATQLPASRVLATISILEMRRLIRRLSSTSFVRI